MGLEVKGCKKGLTVALYLGPNQNFFGTERQPLKEGKVLRKDSRVLAARPRGLAIGVPGDFGGVRETFWVPRGKSRAGKESFFPGPPGKLLVWNLRGLPGRGFKVPGPLLLGLPPNLGAEFHLFPPFPLLF